MTDLEFRALPYDHPVVVDLISQIFTDQTVRYGSPDETVLSADEFAPPNGVFLTVWQGGEVLGCAAWRSHEDDAELKRMFTVPAARNKGVAIALLTELENHARAAGRKRMILETGEKQPEAIALYTKLGYRPVEPFGFYKDYESARHLGRDL
ncbi:GNAT family N-acetyltransferase [Longispora albida]|uniref:GNAT family N-acetyltransferase n=1 Tax=Longispora albida TaxID=203523 RepID=UPI00037E2914|nr:GNAT family N-acetyltransferase [Longispora albida]